MSKRYLRRLVEEGYVSGWDDPRMPTLCAMRRRGYTPASIRNFIERAGISKADSVVDLALLEALRPRRPGRDRAARDGRAAPAEGNADQLAGGQIRNHHA